MTKDDVFVLQNMLIGLGFLPETSSTGGPSADGIYGPRTKRAYEQYLATRPKDPVVMVPSAVKPWWESKALISSITTVAIGIGTIAAVVGTGGAAALATPEAIGAIGAVITGAGGIYGTVTRTQPIDQTLVAPGHRL